MDKATKIKLDILEKLAKLFEIFEEAKKKATTEDEEFDVENVASVFEKVRDDITKE